MAKLLHREGKIFYPDRYLNIIHYCKLPFFNFKRALIVAGQGTTKHFSRGGAFINQFPSHLPGGCRKQRTNKQSHALLDAIYVEASRTYYVLDIMVWNELAFYDCDTMFR